MGNDYGCLLGAVKCVYSGCDYPQGIHVQAAVRLVEYGQARVEHSHLENLIALLLSTGETHVDIPLGEFALHLDESHLLLHQLEKLRGLQRFLSQGLPAAVDRSLHKVCDAHARQFHRILEAQEDTRAGALFRAHRKQVLPLETYASRGDLELRFPGKHGAERTLTGPVRTHYGVNLTLAYQQVYTLEYLLFADSRMQVFYLQ